MKALIRLFLLLLVAGPPSATHAMTFEALGACEKAAMVATSPAILGSLIRVLAHRCVHAVCTDDEIKLLDGTSASFEKAMEIWRPFWVQCATTINEKTRGVK